MNPDRVGKNHCSVCGREAADGARFCARCGARLPSLLEGSFRPAAPTETLEPPKGDNPD